MYDSRREAHVKTYEDDRHIGRRDPMLAPSSWWIQIAPRSEVMRPSSDEQSIMRQAVSNFGASLEGPGDRETESTGVPRAA